MYQLGKKIWSSSHLYKNFFVNKDRLSQVTDLIITQNDVEAMQPWQSQFCFSINCSSSPDCEHTDQYSSVQEFLSEIFIYNKQQHKKKKPEAYPVTFSLEENALINSYPWVIFDNRQSYASSY